MLRKAHFGCFIAIVACSCDLRPGRNGSPVTATANGRQETIPQLSTDWPLAEEGAEEVQAREAKRLALPKAVTITVDGSSKIRFILIPSGTFPMGSSKVSGNPERLVKISRPLYMARCEIAWGAFVELFPAPSMDRHQRSYLERARKDANWRSVAAGVSWLGAARFCEELGKSIGCSVRLPTEAEWEYACRAGTTRPFGRWEWIDSTKANVGLWTAPDGSRQGVQQALGLIPGGQYEPNYWGFHDMLGNGAEWCLDDYTERKPILAAPAVDPVIRGTGSIFRVLRGGYYISARTVFEREGDDPSDPGKCFRPVIEIDARCEVVVRKAKPEE